MITYIDTEEARYNLNEAKSIEAELREQIDKIYNRLVNVPEETGEWVGQKATYYFNTISQDKAPLDDFCNSLEKLNLQIEGAINEAEATIKG